MSSCQSSIIAEVLLSLSDIKQPPAAKGDKFLFEAIPKKHDGDGKFQNPSSNHRENPILERQSEPDGGADEPMARHYLNSPQSARSTEMGLFCKIRAMSRTIQYCASWNAFLFRRPHRLFLVLSTFVFFTGWVAHANIRETDVLPAQGSALLWSQAGKTVMTNMPILPPTTTNVDRPTWELYLRQAVAQSNAWALGFLGYLMLEHPNQPSEMLLGIDLLKSSANRGCYLAMQELGVRYTEGRGLKTDYQEALRWLQPAAERGLPLAEAELGCCYAMGYGVSANQVEALKWFRLAAAQTNAYSMMNIGRMYLFGLGLNQDKIEAKHWLSKAAELGNARAMYYLAWMAQDDASQTNCTEQAFNWSKKSAELGDRYAAYQLGVFYYEGRGTTKDLTNYAYWVSKAAKKGLVEAQFQMGNAYFSGEGVQKDGTLALSWYQIAASNHYTLAYLRVATLLGYPNLTNQMANRAESHRYVREGAEAGDLEAQFLWAMANWSGNAGATNVEEGKHWLVSSAESGYPTAEEWVAQCYLQGKWGFPSNSVEGLRWLRRAADHDSAKAQGYLGLRFMKGDGVERNADEGLKWLRRSAEHGDALGQNCLGYALETETAAPSMIEVYMWYTLSAKQHFQKGWENIERIMDKLTMEQRVEAEQRAKEFHPIPERAHPRTKDEVPAKL